MKPFIVLLFAAALIGCGSRGSLPSYGVVPDFHLIAQDGTPFDSSKELDGRVWLADFVFTTCNGPCPRMTAEFRKIRDGSREMPDFRLVTITIDPARDTPDVLNRYGRAFGAERSHWAFLTGPRSELNRLSWETFHLAKIDGSLEHSTRFVLVDRKGRIRNYYDPRDTEGMSRLLSDVRQLLGEKL